jgi:hypothetical protein
MTKRRWWWPVVVRCSIPAAVLLALAVPAWAQPAPATGITTVLSDGKGAPLFTVDLPGDGWVAVLWRTNLVKVDVSHDMQVVDGSSTKKVTIKGTVIPLLGIRVFMGPTDKGVEFKEPTQFPAATGALKLVFYPPESGLVPWFLVDKAKNLWVPCYDKAALEKYKYLLDAVVGTGTNPTTITVRQWPVGDAIAGWGPRPPT